jgi:hypothetical protein
LETRSPKGINFIIEDSDNFSFVSKEAKPRKRKQKKDEVSNGGSGDVIDQGGKVNLKPLRRKKNVKRKVRYQEQSAEVRQTFEELAHLLKNIRSEGLSEDSVADIELQQMGGAIKCGEAWAKKLQARLSAHAFTAAEREVESQRIQLETKQREEAALRIQCASRRREARISVKQTKDGKAATKIQAIARKRDAGRLIEQHKQRAIEEAQQKEDGARIIQSQLRMKRDQQVVQEKKNTLLLEKAGTEIVSRHCAVNGVQMRLSFRNPGSADDAQTLNISGYKDAAGSKGFTKRLLYTTKVHDSEWKNLLIGELSTLDETARIQLCEQLMGFIELVESTDANNNFLELQCNIDVDPPDPPGTVTCPPGPIGITFMERLPPPCGVTVSAIAVDSPCFGKIKKGMMLMRIDIPKSTDGVGVHRRRQSAMNKADVTNLGIGAIAQYLMENVDKKRQLVFAELPQHQRDRSLRVRVHGARKLGKPDGKYAKTDPYVKLSWKANRAVTDVGQTRALKNTCNPRWLREDFLIDIPAENETVRAYCSLKIQIYDHDSTDTQCLLGEVSLLGNQLLRLPTEETFYKLSRKNEYGEVLKAKGQIGLSFHINETDGPGEEEEQDRWPLLQVEICGAHNLAKADGMFGKSDPFCKVFFNNEQVWQTQVIKKTLNPQWEHEIVDVELTDDIMKCGMAASQLRVEVHDHDKIGSSNFLGEIQLHGSEIVKLPVARTTEMTRLLGMKAGSNARKQRYVQGQVSINVKLIDKHLIEGGVNEQELEDHEQDLLYAPKTELVVDVLSATDLAKADGMFGKSDPYVKIFWDGLRVGQTKVIKKTLDPVWKKEKFVIALPGLMDQIGGGNLKVEVHDYDRVGNDECLGTAIIRGDKVIYLGEHGHSCDYPLILPQTEKQAAAAHEAGGACAHSSELSAKEQRIEGTVKGSIKLRLAVKSHASKHVTRRRRVLGKGIMVSGERILVAVFEDLSNFIVKAYSLTEHRKYILEIPMRAWRKHNGLGTSGLLSRSEMFELADRLAGLLSTEMSCSGNGRSILIRGAIVAKHGQLLSTITRIEGRRWVAAVSEETGVLVITVYNQRTCESYTCCAQSPDWSCLGFGSLWQMDGAQKQALCARLVKLLAIGEARVTTTTGHTSAGSVSNSSADRTKTMKATSTQKVLMLELPHAKLFGGREILTRPIKSETGGSSFSSEQHQLLVGATIVGGEMEITATHQVSKASGTLMVEEVQWQALGYDSLGKLTRAEHCQLAEKLCKLLQLLPDQDIPGAGGGTDAQGGGGAATCFSSALQLRLAPIKPRQLKVFNLSAAGLAKADGMFGKSDPYCKIVLNGTEVGRTTIKKNQLSPVWTDERFDVDLPADLRHASLSFEVFDYDKMGGHEFLGMVSVGPEALQAVGGISDEKKVYQFNLQTRAAAEGSSKKKKGDKYVKGELQFEMYVEIPHF